MNRKSRLINKDFLDDPNKILLAGSNEEFSLIMDWNREELVETIQDLDEKLAKLELKFSKLENT